MSAIASVPDPLVGRVCALVSDVATQEHSDCRDVAARQLARLTEARARLSAVLAAADAEVAVTVEAAK